MLDTDLKLKRYRKKELPKWKIKGKINKWKLISDMYIYVNNKYEINWKIIYSLYLYLFYSELINFFIYIDHLQFCKIPSIFIDWKKAFFFLGFHEDFTEDTGDRSSSGKISSDDIDDENICDLDNRPKELK